MSDLAAITILMSCALFCTVAASALLASAARDRRRGERRNEKG